MVKSVSYYILFLTFDNKVLQLKYNLNTCYFFNILICSLFKRPHWGWIDSAFIVLLLGVIQQLRGQNFDKNRHFLTTIHPQLVHIVIEWPLVLFSTTKTSIFSINIPRSVWTYNYLRAIHKRRRPILPNLWPPSLPLSAQVTR